MYKKITHSIFEEQFAHPDIAKVVPVHKKGVKSTMVDSTQANIIRRQLRDILTHYESRMRDTMIAISNGTGDIELGIQLVNEQINLFSALIGKYYTPTYTAEYISYLTSLTSSAINMAKAQKAGTDMTAFATQNAAAIESFAQLGSTLMTNGWSKADTITIWTEIVDNWVGQVRARMASDWSTDFTLAGKNESYIISGTPLITGYTDTSTSSLLLNFPFSF